MVEAFIPDLPQERLDDMHRRLRSTRWPDVVGEDSWRFGVERAWLEEMVRYWSDEWDWNDQLAQMQRREHLRVTSNGIPIHVMRVPGVGPAPVPLVLTHGWPWTFWDYKEVVDALTDPAAHGGDPADAFDVYVPSLPGFAFSTPLTRTDVDVREVATLWVDVMAQLGVERFGASGGDWGSIVTAELAHAHSNHLIGAHQTMAWIPGMDRRDLGPNAWAADETWMRQRIKEIDSVIRSHKTVHMLDPQTLAYALADSPIGAAAWLWERRRNWSDCDGDVESVFDRDHLCTTAALYWCTGAIASSLRIYFEEFKTGWVPATEGTKRLAAPVGVTVFAKDLVFYPRAAYEQHADLRRWTVVSEGGHFGPMEQPQVVIDELRAFFADLR